MRDFILIYCMFLQIMISSFLRRGLIMGIWNSHTSVGNIAGSAIAAVWSDDEWGWSFIVPGFIIIGAGLIIFFFLVIGKCNLQPKSN